MNIECLQGVGVKRKQTLNASGIFTCKDMLEYLPSKYIDLSHVESFASDGKNRLIKVTLTEEAKVTRVKGGLNFTSAKVVDSEGVHFTCVWFNQPYMKSKLRAFQDYYVYGKNSPTKKNNFVVQMMVDGNSGSVLSVYKTMEGIGLATIKKLISESINIENISSPLDRFENLDLSSAYKSAHMPASIDEVENARERIIAEKAIKIVAAINHAKLAVRQQKVQKYVKIDEIYTEFCKKLPFSLTKGQEKAISDISKDMSSDYVINRVIDGDVGSGKTMVAMFAMQVASCNNYSSCMLAPTELLATQHYKTAVKLFGEKAVLLVSSMKSADKKVVYQRIKNECGLMIFGTHAVFANNIEYNNLSLIIVDEQHRFGVSERAKLAGKGITPDIISMSATPIPRTLSLIFRGDTDISEIKERPFKFNVQTNIINSTREDDMWQYIDDKVNDGSKVFVVCAKIGDDEDDNVLEYSASNMYKKLKSKLSCKVGYLTGKLSSEDKAKVLSDFEKGEVSVIVSTTIVEVGIDIPDSDIMVIATPERFGLATLHQLRGRVGRNGEQAYCFCLATNINEKIYDRLKFFANTSDGFTLADYDYEMRGAGDVYGTKQHGKATDNFKHISLRHFRKATEQLNKIKETDCVSYNKIIELATGEFDDIFSNVILN